MRLDKLTILLRAGVSISITSTGTGGLIVACGLVVASVTTVINTGLLESVLGAGVLEALLIVHG